NLISRRHRRPGGALGEKNASHRLRMGRVSPADTGEVVAVTEVRKWHTAVGNGAFLLTAAGARAAAVPDLGALAVSARLLKLLALRPSRLSSSPWRGHEVERWNYKRYLAAIRSWFPRTWNATDDGLFSCSFPQMFLPS